MRLATLRSVRRLRTVTFAEGVIDRAAHRRADPDLIPTLLANRATSVIEMSGEGFAVTDDARLVVRPPRSADAEADLIVFLGETVPKDGDGGAGRRAYLLVLPSGSEPPQAVVGLRELITTLDPETAAFAATAQGLVNWHRTHPRCSLCGAATLPDLAGWIRRCPQDGSQHFPRTDVAVIMAVTDPRDRLLLGRAPSWPPGRMSILAGFVEPGETLEQAVAREVREEVGIEVEDVEYVADQPWPFPSSLMIGFTARARQTRLVLDSAELVEARWVSRAEVPELIAGEHYRPSPQFSISRSLVEDWYGGALPTRPSAR